MELNTFLEQLFPRLGTIVRVLCFVSIMDGLIVVNSSMKPVNSMEYDYIDCLRVPL